MRIVVWWAGALTFSRSCKNKLSRIFVILYLMITCEISRNLLDQKAIKVSSLDILVFLKTLRTTVLAVRNTPLTNIPKGFSSKMTLEVA